MVLPSADIFFKISLFVCCCCCFFFVFFLKYQKSVKQFGSRSELGPNCLQRLSADDTSK